MRIGILEINQADRTPKRGVSKNRAERFVYRGIAKWVIYGKLLQMVKTESELRQDAKYFIPSLPFIPRLKAPRRPEGLLLYYPHKDQMTYRRLRHVPA